MSAIAVPKKARLPVVIAGEVQIPNWVIDHDSFRRWAWSDQFPTHGWVAFLNGTIWVDMSMEELFSHNQVKTEFTIVIGNLVKAAQIGSLVADRMLLSNLAVGLSTEPDALFFFWDTMRRKRIRLVERAKKKGCLELEGTPDMVLEVVSDTSVKKDAETLLDLYWRAGVSEYWLVDARGDKPSFEIFKHAARGYVKTRIKDGWLKSGVFGRSFKLVSRTNPLGQPAFTLQVRE